MKKSLFTFAALTAFSSFALADIIKCTFTEPFASTTYSMAQQSLTVYSPESKTRVYRNVSFQIKGPASFELVTKEGKVLQQLKLTMRGSDGMSDRVYPYEVLFVPMKSGANNGIGGCTSNYLKATGEG